MPTLPPEYLMQGLVRRRRFKLPVLKGVVNHPYLTRRGELVDAHGYNKRTGIYFDPLGVAFPAMPEITPENALPIAKEAFERLKRLFHTFPFADEASRSVSLSMQLSAVHRRSMKTVPVHVGDASIARSGKGRIAKTCAIIAIGKPAPVINQGSSPEEFEKRLATRLMAGHPIIIVDNCSTMVEGDLLCSVSTEDVVALRILGQSNDREITNSSLISANGNNISIGGDAVHRSVKYRLDPKTSRPELLQFDYDPIADALDNRPELVIAVLTVIKAHQVAGRPNCPPPWQGFEDWNSDILARPLASSQPLNSASRRGR
jgi:putative DNA primase/helicase